ncbi:MAG: NAD(P)/FAD-dependent oxidoreductase [Burkholderiaceae bacterium]
MIEHVDCVVIGAGVVGLAVARALAMAGRDVTIVEAAQAIGTGISSRNSEVIHAGIHYAPGSLKARLCVRGKALMYAYCAERHVPHRRVGKLVVATDASQRAALDHVRDNAAASGVDDCDEIDAARIAALEPAITCTAALWCPSTGIVDSHALMMALLSDAEAHGAALALSSRVEGGIADSGGVVLRVASAGSDVFALHASLVVNCAGLDAPALATAIDGMPVAAIPTLHLAKGNYFSLSGRAPFTHLIYPLPTPAGLGVHVTPDLGGQAKFGPDVEWLPPGAPIDYAVDPRRVDAFIAVIRQWWPGLPDDALSPAYSGVRPKLSGPGEPAADFMISSPGDHGVPGLINLFGIDSPGLTSSLAIGEHIVALTRDERHRPSVSSDPTMRVTGAAGILTP